MFKLIACVLSSSVIYEVPTHQYVSRIAAQRSVALQRELEEFGWTNLNHGGPAYADLQQAIAKFSDKAIVESGSTPVDLIGKGGVSEDFFVSNDISTWRFLNHFLDNDDKGGLDVQTGVLGLTIDGLPSEQWGCCALSNEFRRAEANFWYQQALTAVEPEEREEARVRTFRSLGQLIHLIQDAYQPSHSRNDSHSHKAFGLADGYSALELWGSTEVTPTSVDAQVALGMAGATQPISGITLKDYFDDASEFSGRNFFSDDTIFQNLDSPPYAKPDASDVTTGTESLPILGGLTSAEYEFLYSATLTTPGGAPMRMARSKKSVLDFFDLADGDAYTLASVDDRVVRDHASVLLPRATRSSIGVLDHFFRGDLGLALVSVDGETRLEITNLSTLPAGGGGLSLGDGSLRLNYATVAGTQQPVPGFSFTALPTLAPGESYLLEGDIAATMNELVGAEVPAAFRAIEDRTVTVVFDGKIGPDYGVCASQVDVLAPPSSSYPGLVLIEPGTFQMGSNAASGTPYFGKSDEKPVHQVTISQPFWMGRYEVTQAEYQALIGVNPSLYPGADRPVERVTWFDAVAYCDGLNAQQAALDEVPEGYQYRLPTEAEWEYACRAGTTTEFHYGSALFCDQARFYYSRHSDSLCGVSLADGTAPVGSNVPNAFGLYDMHGNVWEWCMDGYSSYTSAAKTDPYVPGGSDRVIRGGSWGNSSNNCRSARRFGSVPGIQGYTEGFRVALAPVLGS